MKKFLMMAIAPVLVVGLSIAICTSVGCSKPGPVVKGEGTNETLNPDKWADDGSGSGPDNTRHLDQ